MEIWCVKGMHRIKLISSLKNSGFEGLINTSNFSFFFFTMHVLVF